MRPLDPLSSIKSKLGVIIVAAVGVAELVVFIGVKTGYGLIVGGVIGGILAMGMIQFLARGMTSPLREMAMAAGEMAKGNYDRRVTATSRDEVGELARAFNTMAGELAEVDRMRRDLIANVSHELRTPISALQAVLENLVDGVQAVDPATFKTMLNQVERLGRLIEQLLDLSRLESGAVPLTRQSFGIADLLEQAGEESRLGDPSIQLTVTVEPRDLKADADPERVHQVIANLLENAIRHSPSGGKVQVRASSSKGQVMIEVSDEGPGIPPAEVSRVFERFYRSDAARSSEHGGTGLGLAIAKWIVDLHGGDISVHPVHPHGCRMVVSLPMFG
ncbi:MAG: ATP-binding protein [Actinomycetota bacterium]